MGSKHSGGRGQHKKKIDTKTDHTGINVQVCVCFPDGVAVPSLFSLRFPRVTSEPSVLRGCRSVYAAAGDESEAVEEINKQK